MEFNQQSQQFSRMLKAFAYKLTQDMERAKDLYQDTIYRGLAYKDRFEEGSNLKAWLHTIMKNIFINDYRKRMRASVIMDSSGNDYLIDSGKEIVDNDGESNIMMKELTEIIDKLEEELRLPFLMHYQGYKYHEIADKFEIPLGTVKSRIFFARKELKKEIQKRYVNQVYYN
jgi:RNA polymerase sigma-70 factor (ECF subfamily)